mmetsp:Transcript_38631/g.66313  ORF Transcript_38631/g.66313 Transcript_38631/m.66313 type:complete len:117 (-) Transcript_38631:15-365(-)
MKESFSDVATLVTIYIAEAHSADEWKLDENDNIGVCYLQPKTLKARVSIAKKFVEDYDISSSLYVDSIENTVMNSYGALPERLYVIKDKKIAFRGGIGPFQYSIDKVVEWLKEYST